MDWRDISGFTDVYQVNEIGQVRSCRYGNRILKPAMFSPNMHDMPYHRVTLCYKTQKWHMAVARIVASTFIPNPLNKPQVDHINRNPSDNRVENLRWATSAENCANKTTRNPLGVKGVQKHSRCKKYQAHIGINGHSTYLGLYDTIEEAHAVYMAKAKELHGDFAAN
jgi:hypothetical protein